LQVTTAYLWLDEALRHNSEAKIDSFINSRTWDDTAKIIVSNIYRMQDDDPFAFYWWTGSGIQPNPYKSPPGRDQTVLEEFLRQIGDTGRTACLIATDIIAQVSVTDTLMRTDTTA